MSIAEPNVTEAYAFACLNCGHGWEQSYEIAHRTDASGRPSVTYLVDGTKVPSPLTRPTCRNCEGHLVRIMRAGQVSGTTLRSRGTGRPTDKPKGKSPDKPRGKRNSKPKGASTGKRADRQTRGRANQQAGESVGRIDPVDPVDPARAEPIGRSESRRADPTSDQPVDRPADEAAAPRRSRSARGGFLHLRRRHESPGAA